MVRPLLAGMVMQLPLLAQRFLCLEVKLMGCSWMISGHLISIPVCTDPDFCFLLILGLVRTRAVWELFEPTNQERPAPRTGHTCVPHQDRLIMSVQLCYYILI